MSPLPSPCRQLLILTASLLTWIFVLSFALKILFGAGVSGGWLIIGTMFSVVIFSACFMLKELKDAIVLPNHFEIGKEKPDPKDRISSSVQPKRESASVVQIPVQAPVDPSLEQPRRIALGLNPDLVLANRRRQNIRTSRGTVQRPGRPATLTHLESSSRNRVETLSA